jgi:hypothetical protein
MGANTRPIARNTIRPDSEERKQEALGLAEARAVWAVPTALAPLETAAVVSVTAGTMSGNHVEVAHFDKDALNGLRDMTESKMLG